MKVKELADKLRRSRTYVNKLALKGIIPFTRQGKRGDKIFNFDQVVEVLKQKFN